MGTLRSNYRQLPGKAFGQDLQLDCGHYSLAFENDIKWHKMAGPKTVYKEKIKERAKEKANNGL